MTKTWFRISAKPLYERGTLAEARVPIMLPSFAEKRYLDTGINRH